MIVTLNPGSILSRIGGHRYYFRNEQIIKRDSVYYGTDKEYPEQAWRKAYEIAVYMIATGQVQLPQGNAAQGSSTKQGMWGH